MKRGALPELEGVRIEGGALSSSVVRSLMERRLKPTDPASYHLEDGYTVGERVAEDWNKVRAAWRGFQKERERAGGPPGAGLTRDRLLLPLFACLGYGRLPYEGGLEANGTRYSISHRWGDVPIHLVGADTPLDSRTAGTAGAARRSPHGLVQEYLNTGAANPWGFVSNGLRLRLLRENRSIVRQSYLEFDLEAILEGESFSSFTALWMLCHQSRLEGRGEAHILERWRTEGVEEGERALQDLKSSVVAAIRDLGSGFLSHPANTRLKEDLRKGPAAGGISAAEFYHEILRIVYRLIFLFVAEDREALLDPRAAPEARLRYREQYSTRRLRDLARTIRGGGHGDIWRGLVTVMDLLAETGCPELALPTLGSFLWERSSVARLAPAQIANRDLLSAVRHLAFTERNRALWPTDFRNLGSEELGSVYESLLEYHPELNADAGSFDLAVAAGNDKKTSGSYYTPSELVERLLDEALDPVLDRAAREPDPERAILALKVCDPAMGSGHFLVGAARRMAKRLAEVRTGDPEPGPEPVRRALGDVVRSCIYGVDINPLAVELCKISLWMEALDPGIPLSFLDHHIKCGNSLVGATRELMAGGIPDGAYEPLTGDDPAAARAARKRNSQYRGYEGGLFPADQAFPDHRKIADRFADLSAQDESTLEGVRLLALRYREILDSPAYKTELSAANAWCSAFFQTKRAGGPEPLTEEHFAPWRRDPGRVPAALRERAEALAARAGFFHWDLAFPEVFRGAEGRRGGFDVVLGNPPWERIKLQETEWFAERSPEIAGAPNAAARKRMIQQLEKDGDPLYAEFQEALRLAEAASSFLRRSGRYPLCGKGDVNLFSVFAELMNSIISPNGRIGCILPTGIATSDTTKDFFALLVRESRLVSIYMFDYRADVFPSVSTHFCTMVWGAANSAKKIRMAAELMSLNDFLDESRRFELTSADISLINPNTLTAPLFKCHRDVEITRRVYERVPVLIREGPPEENPWGLTFRQGLFNMSSDSGLFHTREQMEAQGFRLDGNRFVKGPEVYLPLYEAKMIHHYDHRWATYKGMDTRDVSEAEKADPRFEPLPRYWVAKPEVDARLEGRWDREWLIGWRDITNTTNERTVIAGVIPKSGVGHTMPLFIPGASKPYSLICLLASITSLVQDYIARQKIGGTHLTYSYLNQFPILPPSAYSVPCPWEPGEGSIADWIKPRVLELVYTSHSLSPFARDLGYQGPPFPWDPERRFRLRCELDAAFFHLYGITREDADYILDTFPIVRKHDEQNHGEYRTKRVILEFYDEYTGAMIRQNPPGFDLGRELEKVMTADSNTAVKGAAGEGQARTAAGPAAGDGARGSMPAKAEAGPGAGTGAPGGGSTAQAEAGPGAGTGAPRGGYAVKAGASPKAVTGAPRGGYAVKAGASPKAVTGALQGGYAAKAEAEPTAGTGASGVPVSLPPVPALPTLENIMEYLGELGIRTENNRPKGGGLWVRQGKAEFGRIAEHLVKSGVGVRHYPTGTRKHPKECYEIDPGKRLG